LGAHPRQELVLVDRAQQIIVDADLEPARHAYGVVRFGHGEDRQVARAVKRAQLAAEPQRIEVL
jgi:hypothetical protein